MKYAKKFKVVPYSTETPTASQLTSTFNNALTKNTFSDEKVKIYNQALSRIKDLTPENIPPDIGESKNYEVNEEIEGEIEADQQKRIAKEINELEKKNVQNLTKQTLRDYSNSDSLNTKRYKRKQTFDNEKFLNLLDDLVNHNNQVNNKLEAIQNLIDLKNEYVPPSNQKKISFSTPNIKNIRSYKKPELQALNEEEDWGSIPNNDLFSTAKSNKVRPPNFSEVEIPSFNNEINDYEITNKKTRQEPSRNYYNLKVPNLTESFTNNSKQMEKNMENMTFQRLKELYNIRNEKDRNFYSNLVDKTIDKYNKFVADVNRRDELDHSKKMSPVFKQLFEKVPKIVSAESAKIPFYTNNNSILIDKSNDIIDIDKNNSSKDIIDEIIEKSLNSQSNKSNISKEIIEEILEKSLSNQSNKNIIEEILEKSLNSSSNKSNNSKNIIEEILEKSLNSQSNKSNSSKDIIEEILEKSLINQSNKSNNSNKIIDGAFEKSLINQSNNLSQKPNEIPFYTASNNRTINNISAIESNLNNSAIDNLNEAINEDISTDNEESMDISNQKNNTTTKIKKIVKSLPKKSKNSTNSKLYKFQINKTLTGKQLTDKKLKRITGQLKKSAKSELKRLERQEDIIPTNIIHTKRKPKPRLDSTFRKFK